MLREEIRGVDLLEFLCLDKCISPCAGQHHMLAFVHDSAGHHNGVLGGGHAGHSASHVGFAVHDGGVEFVLSFAGKNSAFACIEKWVIFKHSNGSNHRIGARATCVQHSMPS